MKKYSLAISYFERALGLSQDDLYFKSDVLQNLAQVFVETGDYRRALDLFQIAVEVKENYNSLEKEKHLAELQLSYEDQLKASKIALLEKEKILQESELQKAQLKLKRELLIRNMTIFGMILVTTALLMVWYFYKQKMKVQQALVLQQEENSRRKTKEIIQDFRLKAIERFQEGQLEERKRIAREIHDGIGSDLAGIKMAMEHHIESQPKDPGAQRILLGIQDACKVIREISHQLHPPVFSETGFCEYLGEHIAEWRKQAGIEVDTLFYPASEIDQLPDQMLAEVYRIIQETLANINKHAKASFVEVHLNLHESYLNVLVSDNGIGFNKTKSAKGIGLRNIKERVEMLQGKMELDSSASGTSLSVDLPVNVKLELQSND